MALLIAQNNCYAERTCSHAHILVPGYLLQSQAFLGLLINLGILKLPRLLYWSTLDQHISTPGISEAMPLGFSRLLLFST